MSKIVRKKAALDPEQIAARYMQPEGRAAMAIQGYVGGTELLPALCAELKAQVAAVHDGDLSQAEAMLVSQAHSLDSLFLELLTKARNNIGEGHYLHAADTYMKLALRAQSQCRSTLETLAAIKSPPVIYAKQANVTTGPQQVNNGFATNAPAVTKDVAHTLENEFEQNKQSGGSNELLTDTRASQASRRIDQTVETLGEKHRTKE